MLCPHAYTLSRNALGARWWDVCVCGHSIHNMAPPPFHQSSMQCHASRPHSPLMRPQRRRRQQHGRLPAPHTWPWSPAGSKGRSTHCTGRTLHADACPHGPTSYPACSDDPFLPPSPKGGRDAAEAVKTTPGFERGRAIHICLHAWIARVAWAQVQAAVRTVL